MKDALNRLHDDFVLVPADKAANNVIVVCKNYHVETLLKELGINTTNIKLLHLYTTHSRGEMEVTDIPTLTLQVERGIS